MKTNKIFLLCISWVITFISQTTYAQIPLPPEVPIWDANKVVLKLHKISEDVYAVSPSTTESETSKGIPQATSAGFIVGENGILLIETMLNKQLYDQLLTLVRTVSKKPIMYAVNTSDHGDHCFGNYLLPKETVLIQNEFCKENLFKNYENIKQFMIMLFGKDRGIEQSVYRPADLTIALNQSIKLDLGKGKIIEIINTGTAQSPADLFVYLKTNDKNVWWTGNPFIAESPSIPWLFDGFFLEPVKNLQKIYDLIGPNDVVVPGHGRITNKGGIKFTIDCVNALKKNVEDAVRNGQSLEATKASVTMKDFDKGYALFDWLHYNFNIPNAYNDIKKVSSAN